ncbi:MAG: LLM class flavin-dependent oxidoreductase [Ectothiorhodospiraceae bacterium]|nr:LLM class flavin-dependent oxidoreductase [Ectothiorhodospiraceae bacterium]
MDFGIALPTAADSWKVVERAEALGFSHAWFYDTQMLSADCFVAMGAAAVKTRRIRLGTGVLVPSNRIAAVTANALATLNHLAPGRIDFGVGTGFTARRAMGLGAMRLADMEEHIRVVTALLARETVETEIEGKRRKLRFLDPELGLINTDDAVRLHVSAYGPRARALAARLGAGWLFFCGDVDGGVAALGAMRAAWGEAGRAPEALEATGFFLGCVLEPGEPLDSPRAMAQAGPRAAVLLHRAADEALAGLPNTSPVPAPVAEAVAGYVALARRFEPADAPWLENHRGHLMVVKEVERPFVTADMIRLTTFTGTEQSILERLASLRDAGYRQLTVQLVPGQEHAIEDWARIRRALG